MELSTEADVVLTEWGMGDGDILHHCCRTVDELL